MAVQDCGISIANAQEIPLSFIAIKMAFLLQANVLAAAFTEFVCVFS